MGGKDERIKRPARREEIEPPEGDTQEVSLRDEIRRPHISAPPPVAIQALSPEDAARKPKAIAEAVKVWCKRHLRINEKIHRDDLMRAIVITPGERERWNNACVHLRTGRDKLVHAGGGYWIREGARAANAKAKSVRPFNEQTGYQGQVIVEGITVPYTSAFFEMDTRFGESIPVGLKIVVPERAGPEAHNVLRWSFERAAAFEPDPNFKVSMIHKMISTESSPGSKRPGAKRRITRSRVKTARLLGAWVSTIDRDDMRQQTTYTIVYDHAEKI